MIKNVYANGPFIQVTLSGQSYNTPYINMSNASAGMVRYNNNQFEVYDGSIWHILGGNGSAMISMDHGAEKAIMWAQEKIAEEQRLKQLAEQHPAVADAVNKLKIAEDELKVITALVEKQGDK